MPHKSCLRCAYNNGLRRALPYGVPTHFPEPALQRNGARLDAISKADAAMSRLVIAAGLKLIVVPIDSTWMRRSLASGSRARASHASSARAGRSRQRQSKWAGSTRRCTRTALVTAFLAAFAFFCFFFATSIPGARPHHQVSGPAQAARSLLRSLLRHPRWPRFLRARQGRGISVSGRLCLSHPHGGEAGQPSSAGANEIRTGNQSENG
jgi:hypothetical protein